MEIRLHRRDYCDLSIGFTNIGCCVSSNKDRCLRHVGIILDGNRRHARRRGVGDPREIYQFGADKLTSLLVMFSVTTEPKVVSISGRLSKIRRTLRPDRQPKMSASYRSGYSV